MSVLQSMAHLFFLVGDLFWDFHDVAFLPSRASFSTTFLKNCGRGESLRNTTYLITVFRGKQGHSPCKILLLQQILLCVSQISLRSQFFHKVEPTLVTLCFEDIAGYKTVVSVCAPHIVVMYLSVLCNIPISLSFRHHASLLCSIAGLTLFEQPLLALWEILCYAVIDITP